MKNKWHFWDPSNKTNTQTKKNVETTVTLGYKKLSIVIQYNF